MTVSFVQTQIQLLVHPSTSFSSCIARKPHKWSAAAKDDCQLPAVEIIVSVLPIPVSGSKSLVDVAALEHPDVAAPRGFVCKAQEERLAYSMNAASA